MADLEINDLDFYQTDYTNASAWEAFNFNLEEVLGNLRNFQDTRKNVSQDLENATWTSKKEIIRLQELHIEVTLYSAEAKEDGASERNVLNDGNFSFSEDLRKDVPPVWKWYGLSAFIVLSTTDDDVIPEYHMKTVQSSVQMAVAETNCAIPIFLRVMNRKANMFLGVSDDYHIRTHYDMIFLRALPANYKYFTGLYDIFKGKVGMTADKIEVAVRLCFSTNELKDFTELGKRPDVDEIKFPFGIETDPIKFIVLHCVWPELPTSMVLHNQTSFEAAKAQDWVLQCVFDESPIEILSDFVEEFADNLMNDSPLLDDTEVEFMFQGAFSRPKRTWSKLRSEKKNTEESTIPDDVLKKFLYYLFPDANVTNPTKYEIEEEKMVNKRNLFL